MENNAEFRLLNDIADKNSYNTGINSLLLSYSAKILLENINTQGSILELGPAEGELTKKFTLVCNDITVVDAAEKFCEILRAGLPNIKVVNSLFEDYVPDRKYDNIVIGNVLEHVENPVAILKLCKSWLTDSGIIIASVPNSNSIHRQVGVLLGLLENEKQLNESDIRIGHRRIYDAVNLKSDFTKAGLNVIKSGGYFLKPLSHAQIEQSWTDEMITAFLKLGERYPDVAACIYAVARK